MKQLADEFPNFASQGFALGDATIKSVAEYYNKSEYQVEIFTGDKGLKSYEPSQPKQPPQISPPRRNKYKNKNSNI
ncbi:MAG: hypothetical protein AB4080_11575 [Trichodesmium sp.]